MFKIARKRITLLLRSCGVITLIFTITFSLSGCGFQLRGSTAMPKELHTLYITGSQPNSQFVKLFKRNLSDRGIKIVNTPILAPYTLYINRAALSSTQTSIASTQQVRQYTVTFAAVYELRTSNGTPIAGPFSTESQATQTMQANELLTNTYQINTTKQQLQQAVITLMIYRLSATDTLQKLDAHSKQPMEPVIPTKTGI